MIEIQITPEMIDNATKQAKEMGALKNSIDGIKSNLIGFLGEECFVKHYKKRKLCSFTRVNNYDFDFYLNGYRIEVKSKETSTIPRPDFTVNINSFNPHQVKQLVDYYFFIYIQTNKDSYLKGYMVGYMEKNEFLKKSILKRSGETDGTNKHKIKHDCFCLPINKLHKLTTGI